MSFTISHKSAAWAFFAAYAARVFLALTVEMPATHNGAWLSALLGGALAMPLVLCLDELPKGSIPLRTVGCAAAILDASTLVGAITRSAGYLALSRVPTAALMLPVALAALWCAFRGGDAVGRSAMVWARLFPALMLLVIVLQAKRYRPEWLAPILGNGWRGVVAGGIRAAGCAVPAASVLSLCEPGESRREVPLVLLGASSIAAALIALRLMMTPTMPGVGGWVNRLDTLLTNGRAPLYLQLPMIALWYAGLLHALACDCFASAALMQRLMPRLGRRACGITAVAAACAAAPFIDGDTTASFYPWLFIVAASFASLATLSGAVKEGRACAG